MRAARRSVGIGFALLLTVLTGCEGTTYPTENPEKMLVVHGLLLAGTDQQEIVLEYTRSIPEGYYRGVTPASGAQVTVTNGGVHRFSEHPDRPGIYRASFTPRPGERYTLWVQGPAGETVTGTTTVPAAPRLIAPSRDTIIARGREVTLRWTRAPHAAAYIWIQFDPNNPTFFSGIPQSDTAIVLGPEWFDTDTTQVQAAAVDSNYASYERGRAGELPGARYQFQSTVQGGWGLFGAVALSEFRSIILAK